MASAVTQEIYSNYIIPMKEKVLYCLSLHRYFKIKEWVQLLSIISEHNFIKIKGYVTLLQITFSGIKKFHTSNNLRKEEEYIYRNK